MCRVPISLKGNNCGRVCTSQPALTDQPFHASFGVNCGCRLKSCSQAAVCTSASVYSCPALSNSSTKSCWICASSSSSTRTLLNVATVVPRVCGAYLRWRHAAFNVQLDVYPVDHSCLWRILMRGESPNLGAIR